MPTVIHSVNPYLEPTMVWIYDQIRNHERYRPIVYSRYARNLDRFPVENLVDFTSHGRLVGLSDRLIMRVRGTYPRTGRQAVRDGADLIHAHFGQEGYRCLAARKVARIPMVTTFYGMDVSALPEQAKWKRRFRRLFEEGDLFLAEGPHMARCLCDIGCPEEKVRVQRLGIDLGAFSYRAPRDRDGRPEVLMIASLREKKGHRFGIDAFCEIARLRDDVFMTIVGDGPLRDPLEARVRRLGLQDRVFFKGSLPHRECKELLQQACVLLYPSITAEDGDTEGGAPVGILEAMAAGLPVISTRHADIPYVLRDGASGMLVDEGDVEGMVRALQQVLESGGEVDQLASEGRRTVEERHSIEIQVRSLEAIYDEVLWSAKN